MPDDHQIEAIQARLAQEGAQLQREAAVRQAVMQLAPAEDHGRQPYPELLRRLQQAIAAELATIEGEPDGTL